MDQPDAVGRTDQGTTELDSTSELRRADEHGNSTGLERDDALTISTGLERDNEPGTIGSMDRRKFLYLSRRSLPR